MRVNVALPPSWPIVEEGPPRVAEVLPGVSLSLGELEPLPLPADLRAWEDRIVFAGHAPASVKVGQVKDTKTDLGWPVSIFGSNVHDVATGAFVERRLHALYRFDKFGGVAILRSDRVALFDSVVDEVLAALLKAGPDWTSEDLASVTDLYRGLTVERKSTAPTASGSRY